MLLESIKKYPTKWMYSHLHNALTYTSSEEINLKIEEFLKFMYISSIKGAGFIPLSKEIDEVWHEYILQTKEYEELCMALPGKAFIHHQTGSLEQYSESNGRQDTIKNMLEWLPYYYSYFGEFTEKIAHHWTMIRFLMNELNLSLFQINQMAKDEAKNLEIN